MLTIQVDGSEFFDEQTNEFKSYKGIELQLEHSLLSLSKWESKWKKPFLSSEKTVEESFDYVKCMVITHNVPEYIWILLTENHLKEILEYMQDTMTATTINVKQHGAKDSRIVTAEVIYYWMTALNIPFDCQKWHLSRLLTLIQVSSIEQGPKKKMSRSEILSQNKSLNAARRAKLNSKG